MVIVGANFWGRKLFPKSIYYASMSRRFQEIVNEEYNLGFSSTQIKAKGYNGARIKTYNKTA